ncbi:hypothetical protein C2G38_2219271 [Gigaspora rosea]|uniref:Uncharacterized protein n=1 Tax=Gigaspora rosea TaxID=44941 RepID=A0A397U5N5_9GLOM|nr:hypothetical protein C2G38_2219271 [Gigaspora rosea]
MHQLLVNKLNADEELEIKGRRVIFKSEGQVLEETIKRSRRNKAQQIHENMTLYLQDLNQISEIEPIIPIELTGRTWEEKLSNVCDLIVERGWSNEVRKELCQRLTDAKKGLLITITILERIWESDFSGVMLVEARRLRDEETQNMLVLTELNL